MGVRDALLLNLTGSNFQALQTNDTARVKGDLSLQKDDGTEVLGIDVSTATLNLTGGITGSGNISSSLSSTGSFGRVEATTFHGDATLIRDTLPRSPGIVTQSAQLAAQISGAFTAGFEYSASISGSATSTGSFGRVEGEFFFGDGSGLASTLPRSPGILTGSAQIASRISGSFNKGFQFSGTIQTTPGGAWSTGGTLNANTTYAAGFGTKAAAISAGTTNTNAKTEEYNGTNWSEVNDLNSGRGAFEGTGTSEAGVVFGGSSNNTYTEEWNGTNWSEVNNLTMGRSGHQKLGITSEAALAVGGSTSEPGYEDADVESWNGTNWSAGTVLPAASAWGSSAGTYDSGIVFKWPGSETFCWNGSSWSEVADRTLARHCSAGAGSSNDALITGGNSPTVAPGYSTVCTELYNGTSWSTGPNLAIGRGQLSSAEGGNTGTGTTMVFGGAPGNTATEHYNLNVTSASFGRLEFTKISGDGSGLTSTLPYSPGILSSSAQIASQISGSFNKGFEFSGEISGSATSTGSFGRVVANKFFGDATGIQASLPYPGVVTGSAQIASRVSGSFNKGFEFSGKIAAAPSAWLLSPEMVNGRHRMGGKGTYNAAIAIAGGITNAPDHSEAGYVSHPSHFRRVCNTEEFNGTTWTEVNDLNFGGPRGYGGTTEDGAALGAEHPESNGTEHWNGTNWSEGPAIDTGTNHRDGDGGGCTPTKLYAIGGFFGHLGFSSYNKDAGTFAAEPAVPSGWSPGNGHVGNADDLLVFGNAVNSATKLYNGSSWAELPNSLFPDHSDSTGQAQLPGGGGRIFPHPYAHVPSYGAGTNAAFSGTSNDAYSYGGQGAYGSSLGQILGNVAVSKHYNWDGSSWSYQGVIPTRGTGWTPGAKPPSVDVHGDVGPVVSYPAGMGHHEATGVGAGAGDAFVFGGYYAMSPSAYPTHPSQYDYILSSGSYYYPEKAATLSTGLLNFTSGSGDATPLQGTIYPSVLSGSTQIAADISGSFNKGFNFSGQISGSATSTGSFGRLVADNFFGSALGIQSSLPYPSGILSSSAQIASRVSGSFTSGFTHGGEISGLKVTAGGVWVTSGDLIVPRHSGAMAGTQNAAFYIAGNLAQSHGWYGGGNQTCTEEYNGTNWSAGTAFPLDSEGTNLLPLAPAGPDPAGKAGTGTQNAALVFGGQSHYQTPRSSGSAFEYDGTAFTQVAFMPENMERHIGAGTQNATISYGGYKRSMSSPYPTQTNDYAHTWNGSVWSNITKMNNARSGHASTPNGTVNSTMAMGATANSPDFQGTECWNGSSWSELAEQNIRRVNLGGAGSPDDAQIFGGQGSYGSNSPLTNGTSEYWNGTVWVTGATMNRAGGASGDGTNVRGAGTAAAALAAGGYPGAGAFTGTEEYLGASSAKLEYPVVHAKTFTSDATQFTASLFEGLISGSAQVASHISGAFSSGIGHVFNTGDNTQGSAGGVKSSFQAGGVGTGTWKMSKSAIIPRGASRLAGTQNSALLMGGDCITSNGGCCVEAWDGTAWEERQGLASLNNQGFKNSGGYGTQNAAMVTAGRPNMVTETAQYNGSTWSEVNNFNQSRGSYAHSGCSQNDAIMTGGLGSDNASQFGCTEIWDGTTWTEKENPIRGNGWGHVGGGSSNAFIMGGSYVSPSQTLTEEWNGVSWTAHADNLYSYRYRGQQGDGSIYNFMHFGGTNSVYPRLDSVEFFDGVGWKIGPNLLVSVGGAFRSAAGRGFGGGMGEGGGLTVGGVNPPGSYCTNAQMFDQEATSTGSFGSLKGFGESTLKTNALFVSGSTFKLPLFSDKDINYQDYQPQEATGSTSGSFERKPDKDIFTRPGNFFFHSDYNALGYTYQSASIYSQSVDFVTCYYSSASAATLVSTASTGFITQSHYCYTTVVCYITGSYV